MCRCWVCLHLLQIFSEGGTKLKNSPSTENHSGHFGDGNKLDDLFLLMADKICFITCVVQKAFHLQTCLLKGEFFDFLRYSR